MKLDVSAFSKALQTLEEGLLAQHSKPVDPFIRDACIQRFEYCYELSFKMLRRFLDATEVSGLPSDISFQNLIRLGYQKGLLNQEWAVWKTFREMRNITSHTYDENKSIDVLNVIPSFLEEAQFLLNEINKRQKS